MKTTTLPSSSSPPFPIYRAPQYLSNFRSKSKVNTSSSSSKCKSLSDSLIQPPPADFNFKNNGILQLSRAAIEETNPELLDLADDGTLVLIKKSQFGPVPSWRSEFVEPDFIWIIGTTHVSRESARDVERVLRALRPENVVVELCRSRAGIMYISDDDNDGQNQLLRSSMFSLSGTGFFGAIGRSISLGGQTALALRLLLAAFSSKVSADINRPFGDEFRAARKISEQLGAQLVLGDRPIEITLERAWKSLTWKEKMSLLSSVLRGITSPELSKINTSKESSDDVDDNFQLYERLSLSYPSLLAPLIYERDTFLAWSLKRSKAVNNSKKVVGVIGKGHMNGVIYSLVSDQGNLRFKDLVGKKPGEGNTWISSIAKDLLRDTIIGILLWLLYEQYLKPSF